MAIIKLDESTVERLMIAIDNGDLQALNEIMSKYNFKDIESLIRFALAILLRAEKKGVYIDEGGNKVFVQPSEQLINSETD